jgi:phosphate transport system protein
VARTKLDTQLYEIRTGILHLGTLVDTALEQAIAAIQSSNLALCGQVIEADHNIDELQSEVEQLAFQSLTLQRPLGGYDLRFLSSAFSIAGDLERMGDNAEGIVQLLLRMEPLRQDVVSQDLVIASGGAEIERGQPPDRALTEASIVSRMVELGHEAHDVLQGMLRALEQNDSGAARSICNKDDVVDMRYQWIRQDILTMLTDIHAIPALQQDARIMQRMTYWLWIAHNLERIGDHCTTICKRIIFFLEGDGSI